MARIQYAGIQSNKIDIRSEVRQVCNLVIEMLGLAVRRNPKICGVLIEQVEHKMILYADGVTFFFFTRSITELIFDS